MKHSIKPMFKFYLKKNYYILTSLNKVKWIGNIFILILNFLNKFNNKITV